ncbi:MAG: glycosyltransferase [Halioglobus sp.]
MALGEHGGQAIAISGKLVIFGCYDDSELYSRNQVLVEALSEEFSEVILVRSKSSTGRLPANNHQRLSGLLAAAKTATSLVGKYMSLFSQRSQLSGADCVFVPYPAYLDRLFLSFLLPRNWSGLVVVDAFLCLHDTVVKDRKLVRERGLMARLVYWLENTTLNRADIVLIDTARQQAMLIDQYRLDVDKVWAVPVGVNEALWVPMELPPLEDHFEVLFYGTFIPLHGVDAIVEAAEILQGIDESVRITLVGTGQAADSIAQQLESSDFANIRWARTLVEPQELYQYMRASHCVLGVFGASEKSANVVPYKAYQAMAANHILITRAGPAMDDLLSGIESIPGLCLVPAGDPQALANTILDVKRNYDEYRLSSRTRKLYDSRLSNTVIKEKLSRIKELV